MIPLQVRQKGNHWSGSWSCDSQWHRMPPHPRKDWPNYEKFGRWSWLSPRGWLSSTWRTRKLLMSSRSWILHPSGKPSWENQILPSSSSRVFNVTLDALCNSLLVCLSLCCELVKGYFLFREKIKDSVSNISEFTPAGCFSHGGRSNAGAGHGLGMKFRTLHAFF